MRIVFKYTSRSRPDKFRRGAESILRNFSAANEALFLVTIDSDDATMSEAFVRECLPAPTACCIVDVGLSRNKIHAINRGLERLRELDPWDILVNMSDDMVFLRQGFDAIICANCSPDTFLHLPDGHQNEKIATMSIMGRTYFERFGYIYHPDYSSVYCDNEAQDVAKLLGCYRYVNERGIFEHMHPVWKRAEMDEQYKRTETKEMYAKDGAVYHRRKAAGFPNGGPLTVSILIPTVPSRAALLARLLENIKQNNGGKVEGIDYEILIYCTEESVKGGPHTGAKRNKLVRDARGDYVWFVDDDDLLMNNSLSGIIDLCRSERRDIVAISGKFTVDGAGDAWWSIRKAYRNRDVMDPVTGIQHLQRSPNHITPTRRELALRCKFPDRSLYEDANYATQITPLVRSESILEKFAYHYDYTTTEKPYAVK
jgi:hypothetical protein